VTVGLRFIYGIFIGFAISSAYIGPMIETKHFRLLKAIHETSSVSGAARALGYSQPAVTQQLSTLERSLRVMLVSRSRAGARLTEAGQVLLRHGETVLTATALAESEVAAIAGLRSGNVRLASFPSAAATILPGAMARMSDDHPAVAFSLVEAEALNALAMVRRGECDIAVVGRYSTELEQEDLSDVGQTVLIEEQMLVALHSGHRLAEDQSVSLLDLAGDKWIAGCPNCRGHLLEACRLSGFVPRITFETDDYLALQGLASKGLGVAMLPQLAVATAAVDGLTLHAARPSFSRIVTAVYTPDMAKVPAVRETLNALLAAATEIDLEMRKKTLRGDSLPVRR
jgi:molybdate transport repressor ModE-like protein